MYLRKDNAGSAPGYEWPHDGAVIEVDDELAEQLLAIPNGGFHAAEAPPAEAKAVETKEEPGEEVETEEPKKSPGRPKLPRDDKGKIIRD